MKRTQLEAMLLNRLHIVTDPTLRGRCVTEVLDALFMLPETFVLRRADGQPLDEDEGFEFAVCSSLSDHSSAEVLGGAPGVVHRLVPIDAATVTTPRAEMPGSVEMDFDRPNLTVVDTDTGSDAGGVAS